MLSKGLVCTYMLFSKCWPVVKAFSSLHEPPLANIAGLVTGQLERNTNLSILNGSQSKANSRSPMIRDSGIVSALLLTVSPSIFLPWNLYIFSDNNERRSTEKAWVLPGRSGDHILLDTHRILSIFPFNFQSTCA